VLARWLSYLGTLLVVSACGDAEGSQPLASVGGAAGQGAGGDGELAGAPNVTAQVELGVPDGEDGLGFLPLADGAVVKLQTFGQGGTHIMVGVRCTGFGSRAFVSATLHNDATGVEVAEPPPARPQLLYCEGGVCDLVPYLVHASGIAATDAEKDGLQVRLTVTVTNEAGVTAEGSREVVLSTADL
jgi:hypothetical protein